MRLKHSRLFPIKRID